MFDERAFDQILGEIERGEAATAAVFLVGMMTNQLREPTGFAQLRSTLRAHPLHRALLEDPFSARAYAKPRGYAGDAVLIDYIYDRLPPPDTSPTGKAIFAASTRFQGSQGVCERRNHAEAVLSRAWSQGKRICAIACGHLREADALVGKDLRNIVAVDQDPLSLGVVASQHDGRIGLVEANAITYLRNAARDGERFDLIYTLGLTDYFDERAMRLLHKLMKQCLAPGGRIMVANFLPGHLSTAWMDAVMDWHLVYRTEAQMESYAREIAMRPHLFRDASNSIVFCEMTH